MKKIILLIALAFFVITACMVYLLKAGISLSPSVLIKPSHFDSESTVVAAGVQRLFPQLSQYKRWGVSSTEQSQALAEMVVTEILNKHDDIALTRDIAVDSINTLSSEGSARLYIERFARTDFSLSTECVDMKRLNYKCFVEVSLHKSRRKIKDDGKKYFLMTSYLEKHFLLLIEE
jgi:hypothetical protein